jgi:hypothetical protein
LLIDNKNFKLFFQPGFNRHIRGIGQGFSKLHRPGNSPFGVGRQLTPGRLLLDLKLKYEMSKKIKELTLELMIYVMLKFYSSQ